MARHVRPPSGAKVKGQSNIIVAIKPNMEGR